MRSFDQQQDRSFEGLRAVLRSVKTPQRTDSEWLCLEHELMTRLEEDKKQRTGRAGRLTFPVFYPLAAAAAILLAVLATTWIKTNFSAVAPIQLTVLDTPSDASLIQNAASMPVKASTSIQVAKNKKTVLKTGSTSVSVRMDDGSGFLLKAHSVLDIVQSDQKAFSAILVRGEILASVTKQKNGREFIITSPNARSTVMGTIFGVSVDGEKSSTTLSVYRGAVRFSSKESIMHEKVIGTGSSITCTAHDLGQVQPLTESNTPIREISFLTTALEVTGDSASNDGMIEFSSQPTGAKVSIGGTIVGTTPLVAQYPSGVFIARVSLNGYKTKTDTIKVHPNGISSVSVSLRQHSKPKSTQTRTPLVNKKPDLQKTDSYAGKQEFMRPEYVEALIQINVGEYRKALEALEKLGDDPALNRAQKRQVMEKITQCYRGLGDFTQAINRLEAQYASAKDKQKRGSLLWQIATMRLNCLGDLDGARKNLQKYLTEYVSGSWEEQALLALAEIFYLQGDATPAIDLYKRHIKQFKSGRGTDRSLFRLARIYIHEMKQPRKALGYYEELIRNNRQSTFYEYALYELHQQYKRLGLSQKAEALYNEHIVKMVPEQWSTISSHYE